MQVFLLAQITSFPGIPETFGGMPPLLVDIIARTGLPGVAITLTFGQLIGQIFVEEYTLQVLNLFGCEFIIRLSLGVEWLGVCHFSWLLYHTASFLCCFLRHGRGPVDDSSPPLDQTVSRTGTRFVSMPEEGVSSAASEEPMSPTARNRSPDYVHLSVIDVNQTSFSLFDYFRYLWSTVATLGAIFIVLYGISLQAYVLPTPVGATYIVFFLVLVLLFYLEGMMIAIVCTQYWDRETFRETYPRAYRLHEVINRPHNVKRFIIGRQFCTVLTGFVLAQITTFASWSGDGYDPVGFYIIVKSGLVGVLLTLSFGQLMPELLAQEYPLRFMNLPGAYSIGVLSLFFDAVGVGHCAWAVFFTSKALCCVSGVVEAPIVRMNSGDGYNKPFTFTTSTDSTV